jgi:hypothetical protein
MIIIIFLTVVIIIIPMPDTGHPHVFRSRFVSRKLLMMAQFYLEELIHFKVQE